jgi:streptogramin lyase
MARSTRHRTARACRRPADRVRVRPRLEGLEDRCLLSTTITEFPVPTANAGPYDITAGPDGNLWFTDPVAGKIGVINPTTHAISEFAVPTANERPTGIAVGPDGNLWFTEYSLAKNAVYSASKIGVINPTTHAISEFATPTTNSGPTGIVAGPDGNLWFTEFAANKIGEINPTTHAISEFAVPTAKKSNPGPYDITAGPDGNLWFTEQQVGKIGEINPATHAISQYAAPSGAIRITAGPDGNLWFTEGNNIGMINPATHAISEFAATDADGISAGPDGNLWFTEVQNGKIGMLNPATQVVTEYPIPYANAYGIGITAGPDGNMWFADRGNGSIGVVTLDQTSSTHLVVTQQPPASITAGSPFGLTIEVEDSSGNLVSSFDGTVTAGLASNPGGTTLGGTLTVAASGGVATFSGLTLTTVASGYTVYVSGSGPTSTTTNPFNVVSSKTGSALAVTTTTRTSNSLRAPLVLDSPDLLDGLGIRKRSRLV